MASILLGSIGSAIAGPLGGMIGGQAGSMLDSVLLNHKHIHAPSLQDLLVEASTMGLPVPVVYGRNKIAGNLIQSNMLQAEKHSGKGSLFSNKNTAFYTFNVTCAVAICRGPIRNIWRIFADSKLIWDMDPFLFGANTTNPNSPLVVSGWAPNADGTGGTATLYHYGTGKNSNNQVAGSTVSFYFGTEDQLFDPDMELLAETATSLPNSCPGYRGIAYAVFHGLPLQDYGNRVPNFSFEVNGFYAGPTNVITEPQPPDAIGAIVSNVYFNQTNQTIYQVNEGLFQVYNAQTCALMFDEQLETDPLIIAQCQVPIGQTHWLTYAGVMNNAQSAPDGSMWFGYTVNSIIGTPGILVNISPTSGVLGVYPLAKNTLDVATTPESIANESNILLPTPNPSAPFQMQDCGSVAYCGSAASLFVMGALYDHYQIYSIGGGVPILSGFGELPIGGTNFPALSWADARQQLVILSNSKVWTVDPLTNTVTQPKDIFIDGGFVNNGFPYRVVFDPVNDCYVFSDGYNMYSVHDPLTLLPQASLNIVATYGFPVANPGTFLTQQLPQGSVAIMVEGTGVYATPIFAADGITQIGSTPGPGPGAGSGDGQTGGGTGGGNIYILDSATLLEKSGVLTDGWNWTPAIYNPENAVLFNPWGNGFLNYAAGSGGAGWCIFRPDGWPITLADIVQDICIECGIPIESINVSALAKTIVYGYMISQESSGRAALEPLQAIYQFDLVEIDEILTATLRLTEAANVTITIDEGDLGARSATAEIGANAEPKVVETRKQETEIPQYVFLRYRTASGDFYVKNFSFEIATQYAKRAISPMTTVYGMAHQSFSSTIVLADTNAASIVLQILLLQYLNRTSYTFSLPIKYIGITPGDVVELNWTGGEGQVISVPVYVRQADFGADNTIKFSGVATNGSIYAAKTTGGKVTFPGFIPMNVGQPTTLDILETPPLQDSDDTPGFYWAACGNGTSKGWGCTFVTSIDGGQSYTTIGLQTQPADLGLTTNALGSAAGIYGIPPTPGVWDTTNTVTIKLIGGNPLVSYTPEQVLNHNGVYLIGNEIIGAANAKQNSDGTWTLSTLQRGWLGTDQYISSHAPGERAVLLVLDGSIQNDTMLVGQIGSDYLYAGVSVGGDITSARVLSYTLQGTRIRPERACKLTLVRDASNNAIISWNPRNRINYQWIDGAEQGADENPETYQVDISTPGGVVVNTLTNWSRLLMTVGGTAGADSGVRQVPYTAAQQAADGLVGAGETWNPADEVNMTLSGGNLTAQNTSVSSSGAVRGLTGATAGKFYFEFKPTFLSNNNTSIGVADLGFNLSTLTGGHFFGVNALTGLADLQWAGIAFNFSTGHYWTRQSPAAAWNGSVLADPATDTGGLSFTFTGPAFPCFIARSPGESGIANFGGSAFIGIPPAGYALGWPGPLPPVITATIYEISSRVGRGFPATITG